MSCSLGIRLELPIRFTNFNKLTLILAFHLSLHFMKRGDFPISTERKWEGILSEAVACHRDFLL